MKIIASVEVPAPLSVDARTQVRGHFVPQIGLRRATKTISVAGCSQDAVSSQLTGLRIPEP